MKRKLGIKGRHRGKWKRWKLDFLEKCGDGTGREAHESQSETGTEAPPQRMGKKAADDVSRRNPQGYPQETWMAEKEGLKVRTQVVL